MIIANMLVEAIDRTENKLHPPLHISNHYCSQMRLPKYHAPARRPGMLEPSWNIRPRAKEVSRDQSLASLIFER